MESDNKKWFLNTARAVYVDRLPYSAGASYSLTHAPTALASLNKILACRVYTIATGVYTELVEGTDFTVSGSTVTAINNPASGTVLIFRYCADHDVYHSFDRLPNPDDPHPDPPGGIYQGQVEIYLSDDTSNMVLRCTSCSASADLSREALNEIGHKLPYDRPMNFPIPVTVTVELTQSDLEEYARLCGKGAAFDAGTLTELGIEDFLRTLDLMIYVYREPDTLRVNEPYMYQPYLKKITITDLSVSSENQDHPLDGNATQTFEFKADNMTVEAKI
jgi:hypothetical protein